MGSLLSEDARLLIWKLSECRERAVEQGFVSAALLIRAAIDEIEETDALKIRAGERTKPPEELDGL